jgi:mono/diheme cytochrome c family protein
VKRIPGVLILLSTVACLALSATARADCASPAAAFGAAQVTRGAAVFATHCASCHGEKLEGTFSTALNDAAFKAKWSDQTVSKLLSFIASLMPVGKPATLSKAQYLDVTAFILSANDSTRDGEELTDTSSALEQCATKK